MNQFSFLLLLFIVSCTNQKSISIPENFSENKIPKLYSDEWYILNNSNDDYLVKNENGKLVVEKTKYRNSSKLNILGGNLIGENGGEWGGKLSFKSNDNSLPVKKIKSGNIVQIFKFQKKIFFIEGLAHLSTSEGELYELNPKDFSYKKLIDFEDAPEAVTTYKDKIFIASHQNFYEIENFKKTKIFEKEFWGSLYPNSIAVFDEENIFLGMRSGIVKINLNTKKIEFFREK
ncbi:hypothetical protein [Epilithonimonas lactis]|uniref:Uncharacterized protein n=1 Tax=Epilithonimonas lactis TaxID=421072 RepID=A0A085BMG8_9FLAO|nr:hypothetical protein [Epilithonimonas lactis]KFC23663.1 hypothetical protein IO89_03570 [Epilithonimonas lactis]SEQ21188.1 hypothetical protein SAMN04488097_1682 [Epilithonimonas lactis]